jgi:hypothetical protein
MQRPERGVALCGARMIKSVSRSSRTDKQFLRVAQFDFLPGLSFGLNAVEFVGYLLPLVTSSHDSLSSLLSAIWAWSRHSSAFCLYRFDSGIEHRLLLL